MSETKLYIATRESGHETIRATSFEDFLSKLARWTAGSGGAYIYDSWALITDQGTKSVPELRMVSIAAGRTIKYVNGKYVARGVPAESREEKKEESFDSVFDAFFGIKSAAEPKRARLTWADTKPVDRFPGFSVASDTGPMVEERERHPLQNCASLEPRGFKG